jgi:hypothetical protein
VQAYIIDGDKFSELFCDVFHADVRHCLAFLHVMVNFSKVLIGAELFIKHVSISLFPSRLTSEPVV